MKKSLSHRLILRIIKLKGLKKDFSKDPIDFLKIRKGDVHRPRGSFFSRHGLRRFKVLDSVITEVGRDENSDQLLIFIHGGAFISGPAQHHWDTARKIAEQTKDKIWMCDYPKAPEHKIPRISANIDAIYRVALESFRPDQVSLIGDSAGGTLVASLVQRLVTDKIPLPRKIILVSPVMDASMTNPAIAKVDARDPMLSKVGVLSAKKMCAGNTDLKDALISPLYGSFENFPSTVLCLAENDITYPDQLLAAEKLKEAKVDLHIMEGKGMPHIWPLLPVMKEAETTLKAIIGILKD